MALRRRVLRTAPPRRFRPPSPRPRPRRRTASAGPPGAGGPLPAAPRRFRPASPRPRARRRTASGEPPTTGDVRRPDRITNMDYRLYKTINGLTGNSAADHLVRLLANDLPAVLVVLVALTFLVPWAPRRQERRSGAVLATASAGLSLLLNQPIARLVDRARPYVAHPGHAHLLIAR